MDVTALIGQLDDIGRSTSGGYRRFAWTDADLTLREWFDACARDRGMDVVLDRAGNQWAWWGDPDRAGPGIVTGSHLDSVPEGGAFDGPLGVASAFAAVDELRVAGVTPSRPLGVVNFADEEGARFGVACAGSRLLTGALRADRALALTDADGITMAEARRRAGVAGPDAGPDDSALRRVGAFIELHIEQGLGLVDLGVPVGVGTGIWPHGRWRFELPGEANHAGTTRLADRRDPMLVQARLVLAARAAAHRLGVLATCGKVAVTPNGVNAIPSHVTAWLDARGPTEEPVRRLVAELDELAEAAAGTVAEESWTAATTFDDALRGRVMGALGGPPSLTTGAGHDAGVLSSAGVPSAMLFVRNLTGVSHSPVEQAEPADCRAGVAALVAILRELTS